MKEKLQALKKHWEILTAILFLVLMVGFAHTSFDLCQKSEAFYLENSLQGNFIGTDMASFQMRGEGNLIDRSFMLSGSKLLGDVDMAKLSHLEIKASLSLSVDFLQDISTFMIKLVHKNSLFTSWQGGNFYCITSFIL